MVENSVKLGRIAGIEVGVHYTWLFAFALVAWSLAAGFFPASFPGWSPNTYWLVGLLAALGLFASVLVHELSHSFVALARGQGVHSITLFIFGGVSNVREEAENPRDEFLVSIVGPLTSFALAALFWLALRAIGPSNAPLPAALGYLAFINGLLGIFNLLPGFPLDGGRVLRSIIWAATGNLRRATEVASYAGQVLGFLLTIVGLWQALRGDFLGGLWTAFIGWFLNSAAEASRQQHVWSESLRGIPVAELMNPDPPVAPLSLSVQEFVVEYVLRRGLRAALVADHGRLLGIVSVTDLGKVPQELWATTSIGSIMTPTPLKTLSPEADVSSAVQLLVDGTLNQLPVVKDGLVVGLLSRADVLRFLQLGGELRLDRLMRRPVPAKPVRTAA